MIEQLAELFFEDVKIPKDNILGQPSMDFMYMMQRLARSAVVAVGAAASVWGVLKHTLTYTKERTAL